MSQTDEKVSETTPPAGPETQKQRWLKYGANVGLAIVLAVVLTGVLMWMGQKYRGRADLTVGGTQSLRPQTLSILKDLKGPVTIVGLAPKLKAEEAREQKQDFYEPVADLLRRMGRGSGKVTIQMIDPVTEPAKMDAWVGEVQRRYGGNVKDYRDFLDTFSKTTLDPVRQNATKEVQQLNELIKQHEADIEALPDRQVQTLIAVQNTVMAFPMILSAIDKSIKENLQDKVPDYKGAVDAVGGQLQDFSSQLKLLGAELERLRDNEKVPQYLRDYAKGTAERFAGLKKIVDEALEKKNKLGELKLGDIRKLAMRDNPQDVQPTIAVMAENDWKMLEFSDVWAAGAEDPFGGRTRGTPRLRFAGEQQVMSAVLSLTTPTKKLVVFVRAAGEPLTGGMRDGPYQEFARRLRINNFEVKEKDLSGQFAMMQQQRPMPGMSEATDAEMSSAIWVVFSQPQPPNQFGMSMPPAPVGAALSEHLREGGSAMVLVDPGGDALSSVLEEWGLQVKPEMVLVHETIESQGGAVGDPIEQAKRQAPVFALNHFENHPIVKPIQSLDLVMFAAVPLQAVPTTDTKVTPMVLVPTQPKSWAEKNVSGRQALANPTYDPADGDFEGGLYFAAAAERVGKGRLVVMGSSQFAMNFVLLFPDQRFSKSKMDIVRFPANGELAVNSVLWLSGHEGEKMIGISPAAMQVPRIPDMSPAVLGLWRVGLMLVGMPLLAVLAGLWVWQVRRD